ncbi:hypothetical protein B7P43_G16102 [Cryptotermes secundus]|uniref:HAT C-terminal dimerisation domain-containing protein n=1 Tax=Cryptotermes secundus TaxID=105785 RepID=A0A2J7PL81_9NEOP|nr:hypothetical protein B7P43_G16102 [Cryptotermes secundus]
MPKVSQKTKLQLYQREFEGEMISTDNAILYCRACKKTFGCEKSFQVLQHLNANIHKENIKMKSTKSAPIKKLLSEFSNNSFSQFSSDLCEAFLAADIPLCKLTNPTLRNFIEKYTQCKVPDESTVRKNYVKQCYDLTIESIRDKIQDNFVWVSIDETQDCKIQDMNKFCEIEEILSGKRTELPSKISLTAEQIAAFVHAPLSSCEVERSFPRYKDILRDNRRRLTMENLKHLVIVNCN